MTDVLTPQDPRTVELMTGMETQLNVLVREYEKFAMFRDQRSDQFEERIGFFGDHVISTLRMLTSGFDTEQSGMIASVFIEQVVKRIRYFQLSRDEADLVQRHISVSLFKKLIDHTYVLTPNVLPPEAQDVATLRDFFSNAVEGKLAEADKKRLGLLVGMLEGTGIHGVSVSFGEPGVGGKDEILSLEDNPGLRGLPSNEFLFTRRVIGGEDVIICHFDGSGSLILKKSARHVGPVCYPSVSDDRGNRSLPNMDQIDEMLARLDAGRDR